MQMQMPLDRETLQRTVIYNLENGYIHPCHTVQEHMCTGYLSFVHHKLATEGGLQSLMLGRIGLDFGLIKPENIPELNIFDTVEDMLESHESKFFDFSDET